jgi:biopolymer transport protein ExbB
MDRERAGPTQEGNSMLRSRGATLWVLGVVAMAALLVCTGPAFAQDGADGAERAREMSLLDTVVAGGVIGFVIMFMNIVAMALAIEYFVTMRRDKLLPPELLAELEVLLEDEDYEEALELCEAEPTYMTNVVGSGLQRMRGGYDAVMEAMQDTAAVETQHLQTKVGYITLICAIAPMLGLMGTVYGMIMAFGKIATRQGAPEPSELADSIGLALVTTLLGLVVAVPFLVVAYILRARVARLSAEISGAVEDLFERFRPAGRWGS